MKTPILLIISVVITQQVSGQTPEIERLLKITENAGGKEKIIALADVCKNFYSIDPQKGIKYGEQALRLADSLKIPSAKSQVYNNIGVNYLALADVKTARIYFNKALKNAIIFKDSLEIAIFYNRMGLTYESLGNFDSSLIVFYKELAIYQRIKNDERTANSLENIGTIHLNRGELKSAMTFLLEAKTMYEKGNITKKLPYIYLKLGQVYSESNNYSTAELWLRKGIDQSLVNKDFQKVGLGLNALGIVYKKQHRLNEALAKYNEALDFFKKLQNSYQSMSVYSNIGNVYLMQEKFTLALKYHRKSLDLALKLNLPLPIAGAQFGLGQDYENLKDYSQARSWYMKALTIYTSSKTKSNLIKTYNALISVNNSLKDYAQSVKYYQLFVQLNDSLTRNELNIALDSLKVRFHTQQTESENIALRQETIIKNKTIFLQKILIISSFIVVGLLIIMGYIILRNRQKIKNANKLLEAKNNEISAKAEELNRMNHKLLELSKFKDSMNALLVHDLKNPLNTIVNVDIIKDSPHWINRIKQAGRQMLNIVMNLLDISKYEDKSMRISPEEISLTQILNRAISEVKFSADQKSIQLLFTYPDDFTVRVDSEIIQRVFVNLFTNALKVSPGGSCIKVSAESVNRQMLKIEVSDEGNGIPEESIPFIFDMFETIHEKQKVFNHSTVLGLAFCKMAIEAHTGSIGVNSIHGRGSSFWFTVPMVATAPENPSSHMEVFNGFPDLTKLHLTSEEIQLLLPYCDHLKMQSVYEISDIKDILQGMDIPESINIKAWKSAVMIALTECNAIKYNELINISYDGGI